MSDDKTSFLIMSSTMLSTSSKNWIKQNSRKLVSDTGVTEGNEQEGAGASKPGALSPGFGV